MSKSPDITVLLRRAEENDAELLREIVLAAYSKWISVIGREPTPMTADFNKAVREHDIYLAIIAGDAVGLIELRFHADHLRIENVAVLSVKGSRATMSEALKLRIHTIISSKQPELNLAIHCDPVLHTIMI